MDKQRKGFIPPEIYSKIVSLIPIPTVDLVVMSPQKGFLLVMRSNYPKKDQWWFIGGKIDLGETPEEAAERIAREEIGKHVEIKDMLGTNTLFFRKGWFEKRSQAEGKTFKAVILDDIVIELDEQSRKYKWVFELPPHLRHYYPYVHPYMER